MRNQLKNLPGWIGTGLITLLNAIWLFWGLGEAFYEGWGVPETPWFLFPSIGFAAMIFSAIAIFFPFVGGGILVLAGGAFAIWWLLPGIRSGFYTLLTIIERLFLSGGFAFVGMLFILDGFFGESSKNNDQPWIIKNLRLLLALSVPLVVGLVVAAVNLPIVLTRVDDGDRSARLINGNQVALIWAPEGPGWNWKQDFGGYPSWDALAFYGIDPLGLIENLEDEVHASEEDMSETGLCNFLSEDGKTLMTEPQNIWRMPTVDEISRSLSQNNINAGCAWDGVSDRLECHTRPDKETPLWAPDEPPVYYWAADEMDKQNAFYVSYSGWVKYQPKNWGNPRHGYRCVKAP